jgi:hypothetical protein
VWRVVGSVLGVRLAALPLQGPSNGGNRSEEVHRRLARWSATHGHVSRPCRYAQRCVPQEFRGQYRLCIAAQELQKNLAYVARQAQVIGMYQIYRIKSCRPYLGH